MSRLKFHIISYLFRLKPVLKSEIGKDLSRAIIIRMKSHYIETDKRTPEQKGIMDFHRMLLIMGLSLYRAFHDVLGTRDDLVETVHRFLWRSRTRSICKLLAFFIRRSSNPYDLYLRLLGPKNERFFPCPPWEKAEVELENGTGWHQVKCPYYNFFKEEGAVELTKAYCDIDQQIANLFPDHITFKRQRTLANGDNWCDFYYYAPM